MDGRKEGRREGWSEGGRGGREGERGGERGRKIGRERGREGAILENSSLFPREGHGARRSAAMSPVLYVDGVFLDLLDPGAVQERLCLGHGLPAQHHCSLLQHSTTESDAVYLRVEVYHSDSQDEERHGKRRPFVHVPLSISRSRLPDVARTRLGGSAKQRCCSRQLWCALLFRLGFIDSSQNLRESACLCFAQHRCLHPGHVVAHHFEIGRHFLCP